MRGDVAQLPDRPGGRVDRRLGVIAGAIAIALVTACTSAPDSYASSQLTTSAQGPAGTISSGGVPPAETASYSVTAPALSTAPAVTSSAVVSSAVVSSVTGSTTAPTAPGSTNLPESVAPPAATAFVTRDPGPAAIAWGTTSPRIAVAVSRALYAAAPEVLLMDPADIGSAPVNFGDTPYLPILLIPGTAAERSLVSAEIARLGARWILPLGAKATSAAKTLAAAAPSVRVTAVPRDLSAADAPEPLTGVAVLVSTSKAKTTAAGLAVARLTGKRLGATVYALHGSDPRVDRALIRALAAKQPASVLGVAAKLGPASRFATRVATATTGVQLPGGGQVMFPGRTLVALYGHPSTKSLGVLGEQSLPAAITRAKKIAKLYRPYVNGPIVPTFEIIATVATGSPGSDGLYSARSAVATLRPWVEEAGKAGMYVILDLQPGRANLLDQAKAYEELLLLPHVGLAIDPEWKLQKGQKPLQQIGHVQPAEINSVINWLDGLVAANHLPQKVLVLHEFRLSSLPHPTRIQVNRDGVAVLIHMDGQGAQGAKEATWSAVVQAAPKGVVFGWKNFYDEDHPMLSPKKTMAHKPTPVMISYQ